MTHALSESTPAPSALVRWPCVAALLGASLGLGGCTVVEAWERGTLAKPQMAIEPLPMQSALRAHVRSSREAAIAGGASEGGGCGCY